MQQQECGAVNFLANNPNIRPRVAITKTDPMIQAAKAIRQNAETFFQPLGIGGSMGNNTQCTTQTQTSPAQYEEHTCTIGREIAINHCTSTHVYTTNCAGTLTIDPAQTLASSSYPATASGTTLTSPATASTTPSSYPASSSTSSSTYAATASTSSSSYGATATTHDVWCNLTYYMYVTNYTYGGRTYKYTSNCTNSSYNGRLYSVDTWGDGRADRLAGSGSAGSGYYSYVTYSCPDGGALSGTTCTTSTTTYSCPDGGSLSGSTCNTTSTTYSCPDGGSLSGTTCTTSTTTYSCPNDAPTFVASPQAICTSSTTRRNEIIGLYLKWFRRCADAAGLGYWDASSFSASELDNLFSTWPGHLSLGAPDPTTMPVFCGDQSFQSPNLCLVSGGALNGTSCTNAVTTYSCPNGGTLSGTTCTTAEYVYTCPSTTTLNGGAQAGSSDPIYYAPKLTLVCNSVDPVEAAIIGDYQTYFGRCADAAGLNYWKTMVALGETTVQDIGTTFSTWPESVAWVQHGRPTMRFEPFLCDPGQFFVSPDKCMRVDVTYTSAQPIADAQCTAQVDYVDVTGQGCMQGTAANDMVGYTTSTTCEANLQQCNSPADVSCTQGTETVNGLTVSDPCMTSTETRVCLSGVTDTSECDQYVTNTNCTQQTTNCASGETVAGQCTLEEQTYRCMTTPPQTSTVMNCAGRLFCMGSNCFDRTHTADNDFGTAMAMMETAREGGVYGDANKLFSGEDNRCRIRLFGLSNCCKTSGGGGGMSNGALMGVAMSAAGQTLKYGSYYVFDALGKEEYITRGARAISSSLDQAYALAEINNTALTAQLTPTLSMYGLSVSFGAAPAGATVLGSSGGLTFAFDPTSLAISVAIMVITDMMSCDQGEQLLSLKRGQNLCHEVGSYCSSRLPIVKTCIERTKSYCCYNSRLARIINEQGRGQIGKGWGGAENPQCGGFTQGEFASLDFSTMDLSEFVAEIMSHATLPDSSALNGRAQSQIQTKMQNYYNQGGR